MENIYEILNNNLKITRVIINNFSMLDEELSIEIEILTEKHKMERIIFNTVSNININSNNYGGAVFSSIEIEDIASYQYQNVIYKISIMEDVMTFYCKDIRLE